MIPNNACTLRITAAAGTEFAGASSGSTVTSPLYLSGENSFYLTELYDPKAFIAHAALLRQGSPIAQDSPLLPPVGVWTVSQFQCGWPSSQTS